jgi:hypothetical protein
MRGNALWVMGLVAGASLCAAANADVLLTDADSYVRNTYGSNTTLNYGAATQLYVQRTSGIMKPYVHFDLSALDNTKLVTEARLKMDLVYRNANYGQSVRVLAIMPEDEDWDPAALPEGTGNATDTPEDDIIWDNAPKCGTSYIFLDEGSTSAAKVRDLGSVAVGIQNVGGSEMDMDLDVTALIQWALGQNVAYSDYSQVHGGALDDGLTILVRQDSDVYARYYSREGADGVTDLAPRLEITQVPEPATMALLAVGSAGLLALRRRRR